MGEWEQKEKEWLNISKADVESKMWMPEVWLVYGNIKVDVVERFFLDGCVCLIFLPINDYMHPHIMQE